MSNITRRLKQILGSTNETKDAAREAKSVAEALSSYQANETTQRQLMIDLLTEIRDLLKGTQQ
jgi:hypothetical protein